MTQKTYLKANTDELRIFLKLYRELIRPYKLSAPFDDPVIDQWKVTINIEK